MATDDPAPRPARAARAPNRVGIAAAVLGVVAVLVLAVLVAVPILLLLAFPVGGGLFAARRPRWGTAVLIVCIGLPILAIALLRGTVLKVYRVPTVSMAPTFKVGDQIAVLTSLSPHVGDVVALHPPAGAADPIQPMCGAQITTGHLCPVPTPQEDGGVVFLKRIVAGPGDTVAFRDGRLIRSGVAIHESYAVPCQGSPECALQGTVRVPAGEWYVLGDNRPDSEDSRFWGPVKTSWIIGVVVLRYWPPHAFGTV